MTIKPFLNKMSADLASALGGGKKVSNNASVDAKATDTTGDVSFKTALTQALEPKNSAKTQKSESPKTASTFASAPASSLKTKTVETGKASIKAQDSNDDSVEPDESAESTEPSTDLLTAAMAAQAAPVKPETTELGLNLLSLADAQAMSLTEAKASSSENAFSAKDAEPKGKVIDLTMPQANLTPVLPKHTNEISEEAPTRHRDEKNQDSETVDTAVQLPTQASVDAVNPSLVALMAATPSFPTMPAAVTPAEEAPAKRSSLDTVIAQTESPQKGLKLELAQTSFLMLQSQATLPQSFAKTFQGLNSAPQHEEQVSGLDMPQMEAPQANIDAPDLGQALDVKPSTPEKSDFSLLQADALNTPLTHDEAALSLTFMPAPEAAPPALDASNSANQSAAISSEQFAQMASNMPEIDATAINSLQMQGHFLNATAPALEKPKTSKEPEPIDTNKLDTVSTKQMTELPSVSSQQVTTSKNKSSNMDTVGKKTKPIEESDIQETSTNATKPNGFEHLLSQAGLSVETVAVSNADNTPSTDSTLPTFVSQEATPGDQVMEATAYAAKNGHRELIIKLNPDNLGAVKINLISHAEGGLSAKLIASSPESAALLSQQAESLQASLQAKGIKVEKISVIIAGQGEFSAVSAASETNKSQFQQSSHDHNPNSEQKQQSHTSQQQNFNQEQQQQMAQAFQQQMNQSHRQSYFTQPQSNSTVTATTTQAGGTEVESSIDANPPVKNQTPGAISVLA
jgi:flagellar hook-length control protein FliK